MNKIKSATSKLRLLADSKGVSVQQMAAMILRNRERYSPTLIKRAMLARKNASYGDGGMYVPDLPEYKKGGIYIKPSKRGSLHSHLGVAQGKKIPASKLAIKSTDSPAIRKKKQFAINAKKWKHGDGGMIEYGAGGFLKSLAPLASFIPGVGPLISGAMGAFGGIMDAAGNANDQSAMLAQKRKEDAMATARAGQAGAINPYAPTFKIGGTFKGKRFGGKPNAEVEGGEVLITPDGMQTSIGGPSHAQGGVDVNLPNNTMILSNKKSGKGLSPADEVRPYTSKINKAQEVVNSNATKLTKESAKRNLNKYYTKVFDAYNKQEAKKLRKFQGGGYTVGDSWQAPNLMFKDQYKVDFGMPSFNEGNQDWYKPFQRSQLGGAGAVAANNEPYNPGSRAGYNAPDDLMTQPTFGSLRSEPGVANMNLPSTPVVAGQGVNPFAKDKFDWGNALGTVGEMAPMLYNLGQGLFGKRDKLRANDYANPYEGQINSLMANRKYNIDPELAANESAFRTTGANMRNLGGSRGQVMSNLTGAQNTKQFGDMSAYAQKKNMENQYAGEYAQTLYPMGRDRAMTKMMVDESNAMTDASGRNMIGAGMTGLQQYLLTRRQMKNQATRDKLLTNVMKGYSPYASKWLGI